MPEEKKLPVKMIANRDYIIDHIYKTGRWDRDEIKLVPPAIAEKMVRHIDSYAAVTADEASKAKATEVKEVVKDTQKEMGDEATQALRDKVVQMSRDEAIEYAGVHYGLKIPGNTSAENARAALIQHIDLAGPA